MVAPDFEPYEQHEDGEPGQDRPCHVPVQPVLRVATVLDAVHQQQQACDAQDKTQRVQSTGVRVARLRHQDRDADHPGDHDRDVDEEYGPPPVVLEQETPEQRADRHGPTDRGRPHADGAPPLVRREDDRDDGQGDRKYGRPADPHECSREDQLHGIVRESAQRGGQPEQQQTDDQDLLAAVAVTEHPPGEQQRGEDQRVGVDRPHDLVLGRAQILLDRFQRHVQHGVVQHDDHQAHYEHREDLPAPGMAGVFVVHAVNLSIRNCSVS